MKEILFRPFDKTAVPDGEQNLLQLALGIQLPIRSVCGGKKMCGQCKVIVEQTAGQLPHPFERERETLGEAVIAT